MTSPFIDPILNTNIERVLEEHLPIEVDLIDRRIQDLTIEIEVFQARKTKLLNIAREAGIIWTKQQ